MGTSECDGRRRLTFQSFLSCKLLTLLLLVIGSGAVSQIRAAGITLVQQTSMDAGTATSVSLAFPSSTTAGNWIAVVVRAGVSSQVFSVSDSAHNTYKKAAQLSVTDDTPNGDSLAIFYAENIVGGATTVTASDSISGSTLRLVILEYAGVATANSLDLAAAAQGKSKTPNSGSIVTTANGDLLLGAIMSGSSQTYTAGSGYKIEAAVPATPNSKLVIEDQIQSTAGSASASATISGSDPWGAVLAAFKIPSGPPPPQPNISSLSSSTGAIGTQITMSGTNLGSSSTGNSVTFGGIAATTFSSWSSTSITVTVPAAALTGNVVVTVSGVASNAVPFTVAPNIISLTPSSGAAGTQVTITGSNFGSSATGNSVAFGGIAASSFASWNPTKIIATVPAGVATGNVIVTVGALSSNGVNFTVILPPNISSLSAPSGAVGTSLTITGTSFGSSSAGNSVTFGGVAATAFSNWSSTSITVAIPAAALTGNVIVTVSGAASNAVPFTVAPNITSLTPSSAAVGTQITITGTNFGSSAAGNAVDFGGTVATTFASWNPTGIVVTVPAGATTGNVVVTVAFTPSNGVNFTVVVPPNISSLSAPSGSVGTSLTISGTNLGSSPTGNSVTFGGVAATAFSSWSSTGITVTIPAAALTGNVIVNISGVASNALPFIVAPNITGLTPSSGAVGTQVTITGTNFGSGAAGNSVNFGGLAATTFASWNATTIVVTVPTGTTTGNVVVTVGGLSSNGVNFTVTVPPTQITLVQQTSKDAGTVTSTSLAFPAATTAGNWIAVVLRAGSSPSQVFSVSDSAHNTYKKAAQLGVTVDTPNGDSLAIFYAENVTGGADTVTASDTISGTLRLAILEYSGIAISNSLDLTAMAQGFNTTPSSGSIVTTANGDLLLGAILSGSAQTDTAGIGYKIEAAVPAAPNTKLLVEDQIQKTAGSSSATATLGFSDPWGALLATFRAASSGPPPPQPNISSLSSPSGAIGSQITILGTNLGASPAGNSVTFGGVAATSFANWSPTGITVTIPAGAMSGNVVVSVSGVSSNGIGFTVVLPISITVSPQLTEMTFSQTQQFAVTVLNDPLNGGVTWGVDGNNGGSPTSGMISPAGLFVPGTLPGQHTVTATSNSNPAISVSVIAAVTDLAGVFTHHNDTARTGQNLQEYALSPSTIQSSKFGLLFSCPVDGYLYAEPLYVANLTVGGITRNVVFVATEHDSVFAFDADSPSCVQLWHTSFLATGVTTMPYQDTATTSHGAAPDISPEIGITSTPVIDPATNTIYVIAKTKETVGTGCSTSSPCYPFRLHALDITTGAEKLGGPVLISSPNFSSKEQNQRPALLLANGAVYIGFGSVGDIDPWQGWMFSYNATTLVQNFAFPTTDPRNANTQSSNKGGVWQGGAGPALDASGNIYFETGNGTFDANTGGVNYGDSLIKLSSSGTVADYFTPYDQATLSANDIDMASSGGVVLLPAVGSTAHPNLAIATGKVGILFLVDQTNLGKYNSSVDQDVQEVTVGLNTTNPGGGFFGGPSYWNGNIYLAEVGDRLRQYGIANGAITTSSLSNSINAFSSHGGAAPVVSANGAASGVVWIMDVSGFSNSNPAILYAYDATNLSNLLYSSPSSGTGAAGAAVKFTIPTVANGKVYIGGEASFSVFGLH